MSLAQTFQRFATKANTALYKRSSGKIGGRIKGVPIALLTVVGRTSGQLRTTPVCYFEDGATYVLCGSAGGQEGDPQWFRNLRAASTATLQVGGRTIACSVRIEDGGAERERLWAKLIGVGPFFADYQKKTTRLMPFAVLTPN
ncbi:MAG TPA: nitroreductase/quinone reductase family protein [Jatrophihabitans sp.]